MRDQESASKTALMIAAYRARATGNHPALCQDPWAGRLAGDEGIALAREFDRVVPAMELWVAVRTAYLDGLVHHFAAECGYEQVVLLGAGLDTRAARLASEGVHFFEVDHPATQRDKRERLARLSDYPRAAATLVACDFEAGETLVSALEASGFAPREPALVLWEGVVPYLSEPAVRDTAAQVAHGCHPSSVLVFDYLGKRFVEGASGGNGRARDRVTHDYVASLGEPIRFGTNDPLPLLYDAGFRYVRTIAFDQACLSLTGTYDRAREFRFQHLAVASRESLFPI